MKKNKKRRQELKTRGVKVRSRNKATSVTENALNIMLWDLENNRDHPWVSSSKPSSRSIFKEFAEISDFTF